MAEKETSGGRVELEESVAEAFAVRQHIAGRGQSPAARKLHVCRVHFQRRDPSAGCISKRDLQTLIPKERPAARIRLREAQARDGVAAEFQICRDRRAARFVYPRTA